MGASCDKHHLANQQWKVAVSSSIETYRLCCLVYPNQSYKIVLFLLVLVCQANTTAN